MIIVFQTYKRTDYALRSIASVKKVWPGVRWIVIDDGSNSNHLRAVIEAIGEDNLKDFYSARIGYGELANWAWEMSVKHDPITLWLEDDWTLDKPFNLDLYCSLLTDNPSIGMVRLGRIPIHLHGQVIGDGCEVYLKLHKNMTQYYFSGNPSLRHYRFYEKYGSYPTGLEPGDTELAYDRQVQAKAGPDVVIPFDAGTWGFFGHIGAEKSY